MAKTVVITCKCESQYQDMVYGPNKRLANVKGDKNDSSTARCTVCAKEATFRQTAAKG